ncbi:GNAT family protein [Streptomyces iconiensis]|uniref:GNAT family protein n=1 Tax=Streptomyces iconiensis TaxID=1384038 RepID=A0ABT7A7W9_9ACTN|nr:GNAT family protein [Streptomyces iconiensis]MDJ1137433.1 GNAT family protein [Streptomyces iconiensis]
MECVELGAEAMEALAAGELDKAGALLGVELPGFLVEERARWLWRYRLGQMASDPEGAAWCVRQLVLNEEGVAVGHGGFHGPPDENGMVEVGYAVVPEHRRQGYARATLTELLRRATEAPGVRTVRATLTPDNAASLATLAPFGFSHVGEQWDEEDGRELIYEVAVR